MPKRLPGSRPILLTSCSWIGSAGFVGYRAENLRRGIANAKERAAKERAYFDDPKNREAFYATRKANQADVKFCWK